MVTCMNKLTRFLLALSLFIISALAVNAAIVTTATGGSAISADTTGGSYTNLTGPSIIENITSDIGTGTIILLSPSGFEFDTGAPAVTVFLTSNENNANKNINDAANNSVLNITSNDGSAITFTVTSKSNGQAKNTLTWQNVRVRPTAGTPLASGNITKIGTSAINSVANGTNLGTLTEVAGAVASILVSPDNATIDEGDSQSYTATSTDQFGNSLGDVTGSTVFSIDAGAGGSFAANLYTSENPGTWNVTGTNGAASDTATLNVNLVDTTPPVITLVGASPIDVEAGSAYSDDGATATDDVDGNITAFIITVNPVNTAVLGTYTVTYDVNDSSGNSAIQKNRTVNVVDTTDPVITILGSNPVDVEAGTAYVDAGATALDNADGDITGNINTVDNVNTGIIGAYTATYNVTDASGNFAEETRTVNVVDTIAPVITLNGSDPVTIEVGTPYDDEGATANDTFEGDLTADILTVNPVNSAVVDTYTVTYDVSDSSGNPATQVTRTVNVVDTTLPQIIVLGTNPISVSFNSTYLDGGATASDNYDGDITGSIVTVNPVDTSILGPYTVTYDVTDDAGNDAVQATRTVNVVDISIPIITMLGSSPVTVVQNATYVDGGATASDDVDGDITASITPSSDVDTSVLGEYTVTYDVTDSSGNPAEQVVRIVNVVDATIPVITLIGPSPVDAEAGTPYLDAGATAEDDTDGNITIFIITFNPVDASTVGNYVVTYDVNDSAGNSAVQVTRTVNVIDTTAPVITLIGLDPVTIEVGTAYVDAGATALDNADGDITGDIVTASNVDTSIIGSYTVTYDVEDDEGNTATQVTRTVNVVDTTAPVITILGSNPVSITQGSAYADAGATAADNYNGNLNESIVTVNGVNTSVVGSYNVTYSVSDSSGNNATATRTVNVVAPAAPSGGGGGGGGGGGRRSTSSSSSNVTAPPTQPTTQSQTKKSTGNTTRQSQPQPPSKPPQTLPERAVPPSAGNGLTGAFATQPAEKSGNIIWYILLLLAILAALGIWIFRKYF